MTSFAATTMYVLKSRQGFTPGMLLNYSAGIHNSGATHYFRNFFGEDTRVWSKKKYKFSRTDWYRMKFDVAHYDVVRDWCETQFGPHPRQPDAWSRWNHIYENTIWLRDEDDAILFKLTWGDK